MMEPVSQSFPSALVVSGIPRKPKRTVRFLLSEYVEHSSKRFKAKKVEGGTTAEKTAAFSPRKKQADLDSMQYKNALRAFHRYDFTTAFNIINSRQWPQKYAEDILRLKAQLYSYQCAYERAEELFSELFKQFPRSAENLKARGLFYLKSLRPKLALDDFCEAAEIAPTKKFFYWIAQCHVDLNELEEAKAICLAQSEEGDDQPDVLIIEGDILRKEGAYEKAIEKYTEGLSLDAKLVRGFIGRGISYKCLDKFPEALEDFEEALELYPNFTTALKERAFLYQAMDEKHRALADFSKIATLNPKHPDVGLWISDLEDPIISSQQSTPPS